MSKFPRSVQVDIVLDQLDRLGLDPIDAAAVRVLLRSTAASGRVNFYEMERHAAITIFERRLIRAERRGNAYPGMRELLDRLRLSRVGSVWAGALEHAGASGSIWLGSEDELLGYVIVGDSS